MSKKQYIVEKNRLEIDKEHDCIIIGGGIAGVSAAVAAARKGCRTLIIEKNIMLGGLATVGFVNKYLPLCDGKGQKVCAGICEELLYESIRYGYNTLPDEWITGNLLKSGQRRYQTIFSPYDFAIALDQLVEKEKIDIVFDTLFSNPYLEGDVCTAIIVENKKGRNAYRAKTIIDTTGDADVMHRCGVECEEQGNWLSYWAYITSFESMQKAIETRNILNGVKLWELGAQHDGAGADGRSVDYYLTTPKEISQFIIAGRKILRAKMDQSQDTGTTIAALPGMVQARTTRRIKGRYELKEKDLNKHFEDSIGCAPDWRRRGEVYEIPFACLVTDKVKNIITAGRCISATDDAWEVTRAIPACAVTGQAAGTAAAIANKENCMVSDLSAKAVCHRLSEEGVILHYSIEH